MPFSPRPDLITRNSVSVQSEVKCRKTEQNRHQPPLGMCSFFPLFQFLSPSPSRTLPHTSSSALSTHCFGRRCCCCARCHHPRWPLLLLSRRRVLYLRVHRRRSATDDHFPLLITAQHKSRHSSFFAFDHLLPAVFKRPLSPHLQCIAPDHFANT